MTQNNTEIKLPEKHYITFQVRQNETPLAFMTPWGEDDASKKRMATANSWASNNHYKKDAPKLEPKIINNLPLVGFKIMHSVDRSSRFNRNIVWRIEDPRGFELEISSGNMESIINECVIERGEIQEQCIWGRQKGTNVLLPTNCEEYQQAINNTKRTSSILSIKDIQVGNQIILHDGRLVKYLGKFHSIDMSYNGYDCSYYDQKLKISKTKSYFFQYKNESIRHKEFEVFSMTQPKISSIEDDSTESIDEIEEWINKSSEKISFSYMGATQFNDTKIKLSISLEENNIDDILNSQNNESDYYIGLLNNHYCIVRLYVLNRIKNHGKDIEFSLIDIESLKNDFLIKHLTHIHHPSKNDTIKHDNINDFVWFKPYLIIDNAKTGKILKIGLR